MTNEALATAIRNGRRDLTERLWSQTRNFIALQACKFYNGIGYRGVTEEDLLQSGYFALLDAIEHYDQDGGASFLHFLSFYLHRYFSECAGLRTSRAKAEPVLNAISLDQPLTEDSKDTLADLQEDPRNAMEESENEIFRQQLREALEDAIDTLKPETAEAIRCRYFRNMKLKEVAAISGVSANMIRERQAAGLRKLRAKAKAYNLDRFLDLRTEFYTRTNFRTSFTSPIERIVLRREKLREQIEKQ